MPQFVNLLLIIHEHDGFNLTYTNFKVNHLISILCIINLDPA